MNHLDGWETLGLVIGIILGLLWLIGVITGHVKEKKAPPPVRVRIVRWWRPW